MPGIVTRKVKMYFSAGKVGLLTEGEKQTVKCTGKLPYAMTEEELAGVKFKILLFCYFLIHSPCVSNPWSAATFVN
jgi:hypothetical protein